MCGGAVCRAFFILPEKRMSTPVRACLLACLLAAFRFGCGAGSSTVGGAGGGSSGAGGGAAAGGGNGTGGGGSSTGGGSGGSCSPGQTQSCYDGPTGTAGVGICASGTFSCVNGVFTGACTGETLPGSEGNAKNSKDDDCDGK